MRRSYLELWEVTFFVFSISRCWVGLGISGRPSKLSPKDLDRFSRGMKNEVRKRKISHSGSPRTQSPISFQYVLELEKAGSQNKVPKNNYAKTSTLFPSLTTLNNKGGDNLYSEVMTLRDLVSKMSDDLSKIIFELEYQVNATI